MKIFVYNYREFDEAEYFEKFSKEYHVELGICKEAPSLENAYLVKGYEYVSIITTKIDRPLLEKFREFGVKMISTRTVGYDHIDLEAARQLGIRVSNVSYSPECVGLYDDAYFDVDPKNETDHAGGRRSMIFHCRGFKDVSFLILQ